MIESVHIEGFQSLADVDLKLGRFTVIQGRSNSGKSAVIRALRAVVTNAGNMRGTGHSFIHHGSKSCRVEIRRDTGTLTWTKSASKTAYDLDGKPFTTGMEVPEEVAAFLKMGDIVIDDANSLRLNVNFQGGGRGQGQFEPPFLVVDRPGSYLAKVFALLTSANVLYEAQAVAKKESRQLGGRLKTVRELAEGEQARLIDLQVEHSHLRAASVQATELWEYVQTLLAEREGLVRLGDGLHQAVESLATCDAELAALGTVDASGIEPAEQAEQTAQVYRSWSTGLSSIDTQLAAIDADLATVLPPSVEADVVAAETLVSQTASLRQYASALAASDAEVAAADSQADAERLQESRAAAEFKALVEELETCPTCDQPMHAELMLV